MIHWIPNFAIELAYNTVIVLFIGLVLLPVFTKTKLLRSKRDPYFWRRVMEEGSPSWLTRRLIFLLVISLLAANFFVPIFYAIYVEFFGVRRGNILETGHRIAESVFVYFYDVPHTMYRLNPLTWSTQMAIMPGAWFPVFVFFLGV